MSATEADQLGLEADNIKEKIAQIDGLIGLAKAVSTAVPKQLAELEAHEEGHQKINEAYCEALRASVEAPPNSGKRSTMIRSMAARNPPQPPTR